MILLIVAHVLCTASLDSYCRTAERRVDDQHDQNAKRIMGINNARLIWYRLDGVIARSDGAATYHNQMARSDRTVNLLASDLDKLAYCGKSQ